MSAESSRAVFLSYASQDADAARRICEALRAAGVEVWFDQSELVGGDAWDAKIRKQIKDCALFVPIISATTQARLEGYFRREWRMAVDRMHDMDDDMTFLMPVVIDDTPDSAARVPERFRERQWTRLPAGEASNEFVERVRRLSRGGVVSDTIHRATESARKKFPASFIGKRLAGVAVVLALVAGLALMDRVFISGPEMAPAGKSSEAANAAVGTLPPAAEKTSTAPAGSEELAKVRARIVPERWQKGDFEAVSATLDRLIQTDPENADVWALRSIINSLQVLRIIDPGTKPLETGRSAAEYALRIARDSPLANLALGMHHVAMISRGGDPLASRAPLDRAVAAMPTDAITRYGDLVSRWLGYDFAGTEARATAWLAADPTATYPAWILTSMGVTRRRPADVEKWSKLSESDPELTGARTFSNLADMHYYLRGDLRGARAAIERVPIHLRTVSRVVFWRWLLAMAEQKQDEALQELARVPDPFLYDSSYNGPKVLLAGVAHQRAGRSEAAIAQFREAERLLREKLADDTDNEALRAMLAVALASAGRGDEARRELALVEPLVRSRAPTVYRGRLVIAIMQAYGAMKDYGRMAFWLRKIFAEPSGMPLAPASFRLDPRFNEAVDALEIQALLKEFASLDQPAAPTPASQRLSPSTPTEAAKSK